MALNIYNMVKEIIGPVPIELEFIYSFLTIFIFCSLIYCIFIIPYKTIFGK